MGMCSCLLSPSLEIKLLCDVIWVGLTPFPSTGSRQMTRVWSLCSISLDLKAGPCEASSSTWLSLWRGRFMFFFFFFSPGISNYKNNTELWVTSMSSCRESLPKNKVYTEKSMAKRWRVRLRFAIILFQLLVSAVTEASPTPLNSDTWTSKCSFLLLFKSVWVKFPSSPTRKAMTSMLFHCGTLKHVYRSSRQCLSLNIQ